MERRKTSLKSNVFRRVGISVCKDSKISTLLTDGLEDSSKRFMEKETITSDIRNTSSNELAENDERIDSYRYRNGGEGSNVS